MTKAASDAGKGDAMASPFDRFLRFGTALFAVRKDELPKRDEREPKRERRPKKAT